MSLFSVEDTVTVRALVRITKSVVVRPVGETSRGAEPGEEIWLAEDDAKSLSYQGSAEIIERPGMGDKGKRSDHESSILSLIQTPVNIAKKPIPARFAPLPSPFKSAWNETAELDRLRAIRDEWAKRNSNRFCIGEEGARLGVILQERFTSADAAVSNFSRRPLSKYLRECSGVVAYRLHKRNEIAESIRNDARELFASRLAPLELSELKVGLLYMNSGVYIRYEVEAASRSTPSTFERAESGRLVPMPTGSLDALATFAISYEDDMSKLAELREQLDIEIAAASSALASSAKRKTKA